MRRFFKNFLLLIGVGWICPATGITADRIPVFVTLAPQKYFVEQIGKNRVAVHVMVPPGADPHTYEPKPRQMMALSRAKLYFAIGIEFEKAKLEKILSAHPNLKVIHTDQGISKKFMVASGLHTDARGDLHGEGDGHTADKQEKDPHEPAGLDPHIWLSPPLVKIQARAILNALQDIDPVHRNAYEANFREFASNIDALHADLKKIFAGEQGLQFLVFHPSWGYFAETYGLQQVPVEMEGKDPKPARLKALIEHARRKNIKVIFTQPQFSTKSAVLLAEAIDGRVVMADPLAEDWPANLRRVAKQFEAALR